MLRYEDLIKGCRLLADIIRIEKTEYIVGIKFVGSQCIASLQIIVSMYFSQMLSFDFAQEAAQGDI